MYLVKSLIGNLVLNLGSENNSLYIYYKGVSKQLLTFKFDASRGVLVKQLLFPAGIYLIKPNKGNTRAMSEICWELTTNTPMTSMTSFWCFFCELWAYFKRCYLSTIDFKQENFGLVVSEFYMINHYYFLPFRYIVVSEILINKFLQHAWT